MIIFFILLIAIILVILINKDPKIPENDLNKAQHQDLALHSLINKIEAHKNLSVEKSTTVDTTIHSVSMESNPQNERNHISPIVLVETSEPKEIIEAPEIEIVFDAFTEMEKPSGAIMVDKDKEDQIIQENNRRLQQYKSTGSVFSNLFKLTSENIQESSTGDKSIIDVNINYSSEPIPKENKGLSDPKKVVPWNHGYIYGYDAIEAATTQQKNFYKIFKECFLIEEYLELRDYNNYAFILLFDLLQEFSKNKNLETTENYLNKLAQHYPRTQGYTTSLFLKQLKNNNDWDTYNTLVSKNNVFSGTFFENYLKLGDRYKKVLQLDAEGVEILNDLNFSSNAFCNIDGCFMQVLKIYVLLIKRLKVWDESTSFDIHLKNIADPIVRKQYGYRQNDYSYKYMVESVSKEILTNIFKRCENLVRESYNHKRKLTLEIYPSSINVTLFEEMIVKPTSIILLELKEFIETPDENSEIELNAQNTTRWKYRFEEICRSITKAQLLEFKSAILKLGNQNIQNPSIEHIFFEASKFIAKVDRETALWLYMHYLHYDLKSSTFDNKQLNKTIQKSLFSTKDQFQQFEAIVSKFISNKNLEEALADIPNVYALKRKKIQLDRNAISEAEQQHSGTVELLNEYLQDELEDEHAQISSHPDRKDEIKLAILPKNLQIQSSNYLPSLVFNEVQIRLLELFQKNSLSLEKEQVESFAKEAKVFPGQLIERINELCYEILDDLLIEEDEEYYSILTEYYKNIRIV